jgi:hypothetical protein
MAQQDQKATAPDNEGAANALDGAVNALNATSKNMQAIAGEIFEYPNNPLNIRRKPWKSSAQCMAWTKSWRSRRTS